MEYRGYNGVQGAEGKNIRILPLLSGEGGGLIISQEKKRRQHEILEKKRGGEVSRWGGGLISTYLW